MPQISGGVSKRIVVFAVDLGVLYVFDLTTGLVVASLLGTEGLELAP